MVASLLIATTVFAQAGNTYINPMATLDSKVEMLQWVKSEAGKYNVSETLMVCLINHEDTPWNPLLQSSYFSNGIREESYGLAQIFLPAHPDISREQAQDPKFAISWMASELSKGHAAQWSTLKYCK